MVYVSIVEAIKASPMTIECLPVDTCFHRGDNSGPGAAFVTGGRMCSDRSYFPCKHLSTYLSDLSYVRYGKKVCT